MTQEGILKVLQEIQSRAPKHLIQRAYTEVPATPTIKMVVEKALEDPEYPEDKKPALRALLSEGTFDKKEIRHNEKVAEQLNQYMDREINKAIRQNRLPAKKKLKAYLDGIKNTGTNH